jgi:adenine C2-methylase RlmN of 23S rRNA A2503 and tRNA A37
MDKYVNVFFYEKLPEKYIFWYDDSSEQELFDTFKRYVLDGDLNFDLEDAEEMTEKVKNLKERVKSNQINNRLENGLNDLD